MRRVVHAIVFFGLLAAVLSAPALASAKPVFKAEKYPAKLTGTALEFHVFGFNSSWKCTSVTFSGSLTESSSTLTLSPTYSGCTFFGLAVSANTNGCTYLLHLVEAEKEDVFRSTIDLSCPAGKEIQFSQALTGCSWSFGTQTALGKVTATDLTASKPKNLQLTFEVSNIKYTEKKGSGPWCSEGLFTNGQYAGQETLVGDTEGGTTQALWVEP
jgi:hypothetical protein